MTDTAEEIQDRMIDTVDNDHGKRVGSFIWDALKAASVEFNLQQKEIQKTENKMDIENLTGKELERFIYPRTGQERKPVVYATTHVIISGSKGAVIEKGDLVSTGDVDFEIQEDAVIPESRKIRVEVKSDEPGDVGNVPEESINEFPSSISGLIDVYNPEPVINGYDAETDNELRKRYLRKLQRPGKAGNKYHYEEWAEEVTGVGAVIVEPRWDGPLTVKVVIIDQNKQTADNELVEDVESHIAEEAPFGANVTVESASGVEINIEAELTLKDGYDEENAIENIENNITEYLKTIAFKESFVSYALIGSEIINSNGIADYENLTVNGDIENIDIKEDEIAVLGGVTNG